MMTHPLHEGIYETALEQNAARRDCYRLNLIQPLFCNFQLLGSILSFPYRRVFNQLLPYAN